MPPVGRLAVARELALHVHEHRAGEVALQVLLVAVRPAELPADIEDGGRLVRGEPLGQLVGVDQYTVHSGGNPKARPSGDAWWRARRAARPRRSARRARSTTGAGRR